jgi:hypothetical protein
MKRILIGLLTFAISCASGAQVEGQQKHSYVPDHGFVPDTATAVNIAIAVLSPIYGESKIKAEAPFVATLKDGVWTVVGTLPAGLKGGVAEIEISKATGTILRASHGK